MESEEKEDQDGHRIETRRLILRPPRLTDVPAIAALADNWAVASKLSGMPHPYRESDAHEWIERTRGAADDTCLVTTLARGGQLIGACGVGPAAWTEGRQIGYWLGRPYWGQGYATEAARAVIDLAFGTEQLAHLWSSCRVTNEGSRRVIHKCGFQFHSAGMMFMHAAGGAVPVEHYCLDRSVWLALNQWRAA